MEPATEKAATLIEALSYIQRFRDKVVVVKMGGSFFDDEASRRSVLTDLVFMWAVGIHPVLVHGGGPAISRAMKDASLQPKWASGLRFTDAVTLSIVQNVLINTINKQLVEEVRELGGLVEPIHPRNRPVLRAVQKFGRDEQGEPVDLGYVGDVSDVDLWILSRLVQEDVIPVIAPLGLGADGQVYNVNADTAAAKVAVAMHAEKLINMSDTHGIRTRADDAASTAESLNAPEIGRLIAAGQITGGMIPKVECCLTAVRGGVKKSHIIDGRIKHSLLLEIYTDQGVGTEIVA
jgi:acetylglutamate kinase